MSRHNCRGDDCGYCERRIEDIEYEREVGFDVDDFYDGT